MAAALALALAISLHGTNLGCTTSIEILIAPQHTTNLLRHAARCDSVLFLTDIAATSNSTSDWC